MHKLFWMFVIKIWFHYFGYFLNQRGQRNAKPFGTNHGG